MSDIPENVDLNWIARHMVELREAIGPFDRSGPSLSDHLRALREDVLTPREDLGIMSAIVRRIDRNEAAFREDVGRLFELYCDLRGRVESLEREP